MQQVSIREGEPVFIRAYSTQRAGVGELISLVRTPDREWGQVRLVTELYRWDENPSTDEPAPQAGEVLQVEAFRLEPVQW